MTPRHRIAGLAAILLTVAPLPAPGAEWYVGPKGSAKGELGRAPGNEDCEVRGNVVVNGDLTINRFKKVVKENNLVLAEKAARPKGARVVVRRSKYDPNRAHVAVFNWERKGRVALRPGKFLADGDRYRLMSPTDFFGKPVLSGTYKGEPIPAPVRGEVAAFVLLKQVAR